MAVKYRSVREYADAQTEGLRGEIELLTKENAEQKEALNKFISTGLENEKNLQDVLNQVADLIKENSELKQKNEELEHEKIRLNSVVDAFEELKKELAEAKSNQAPTDERSVATNAKPEGKAHAAKPKPDTEKKK